MEAKEIIELVGKDAVLGVVEQTFSKHFAENLDVYEEFIDSVLRSVSDNTESLRRISTAIAEKLADDIRSGEVDIVGVSAIDQILEDASTKMAEKIRRILNA